MVLPDDFMEAVGCLDPADRDRAVLGAARYAMTEEEPDLDGPARAVFLAAKRAIFKANRQSRGGARGGAARADRAGADGAPGKVPAVNLDQGSGGEPCGNLDQGSVAEPCGEHNRTEHNGTEPRERGARPRGADADVIPFGPQPRPSAQPPSVEEVRAYFAGNLLRGDPEAFFLRYDEVGWVDAQGRPITNWRSTAKRWSRREPEFAQARAERSRAARGEPPAGEAWRPARSASQMLAEIEAEERKGAVL